PVVRDLTERLITEPNFPTYNENEIVTRHGDRRLIAWNNSVQRDADGVAISITSIGEDITARKRYEASIYELTHRLALATGAAKLGIWDWDVVNDILLWDERMYEIYGIDPAAFDGTFQAWLSRVHPEDRPIVAAAEFEAIQTQTSEVHHEYRILRPDGQVRHIEKHAVILRDEQGRGQRILGINCDISDRKQAETTLKALTERLSVATEAAQLGVWDWDVVGQRVVWDERMYAIYGLDAATWTPTFEAWQTLVHPDDLPPLLTTIDAAFRQGLPHYHQEFRVLRQDGQVCSVECHANILRDEAGQPRRVIGVNWDISDRTQAETALQATTERLYLATAAAQLGVWEWDLASDRLTWDERMHIIYGQPLGSFGGTYGAWQAQVHPDDWPTVEATAAQFLAADSTYSTEFRIICPNGDIRHVESYAHMVRDPAGQPQRVIGINRDISHRKQADLALAEAHQQVQALLQNAPTIIGLFDETGRYHQVNSSIARLLDRPPAEIVGRRFDELYPPEVAAVFMARLQEVVATNAPLTVEDRLSLAEEEVILRAVLFPVLNQPGRPKLLGVVAIDITAPIRAQESLQRQAERERLIREITANIRRSLDLDVILESTVGEVRRFLNTDRVLVYRFNPDWSGVAIVESVGAGWTAVLHRTLHDDCFGQDLIERYLSGYISQIDDVQTAPIHDCHRDFLNQFEIRANLVLPLVIEGNLWGLLCIHHCREPRRWLPDEVGFTNQIADQVEIAIQQSQLLQATAIQAQRERLRSLITEHIRDSLDLSSILNTTVEEIRQFLKTDRVLVYRFHPDWSGQVIVESVEPGWTAALHAQLHDPCFQGNLVGQYRRGAVSQMANIATAELSPCYRNFLTQFEIRANLVLPLVIEGNLWGLLCIHHCREPRRWLPDEVGFTNQIADQV
ncbi:MAG TPA: PAS domain-containing protein, partial [Candidatus Obscuribacterales bacterium]